MECIGCGYCCRTVSCGIDRTEVSRGQCKHLEWDGNRWRCGYYEQADKQERRRVERVLGIGAGCCNGLNTYRIVDYVPTPDELEDEQALLARLGARYTQALIAKSRTWKEEP